MADKPITRTTLTEGTLVSIYLPEEEWPLVVTIHYTDNVGVAGYVHGSHDYVLIPWTSIHKVEAAR